MNSTPRYSVRKIVSETVCFVLSLESAAGRRHWVFENAGWMEEGKKAVGVEFGESDLGAFLGRLVRSAKSDFLVSGNCVPLGESRWKLSFRLDGSALLRGGYVLLCPSWGRHSRKKMWFLIPASAKGRGEK